MRTVASLVLLMVAAAVVAQIVAAYSFLSKGRSLAARLEAGSPPVDRDLPPEVRAVALAGGAEPGLAATAVRITQQADFLPDGATEFIPMPATQTIGLGAAGFVWQAESPAFPVPKFRVIDAYVDGAGLLEARVFGSIPVAHASGSVVDVAEAMRYLAELAWVPDAILGNPEIDWTVADDGWIEAALDVGEERAVVRLRTEGTDIVEMTALRPDTAEDGTRITRDWQGHFHTHGEIGGRRIPMAGEVGYVEDGTYTPYWKGRVTGYEILR